MPGLNRLAASNPCCTFAPDSSVRAASGQPPPCFENFAASLLQLAVEKRTSSSAARIRCRAHQRGKPLDASNSYLDASEPSFSPAPLRPVAAVDRGGSRSKLAALDHEGTIVAASADEVPGMLFDNRLLRIGDRYAEALRGTSRHRERALQFADAVELVLSGEIDAFAVVTESPTGDEELLVRRLPSGPVRAIVERRAAANPSPDGAFAEREMLALVAQFQSRSIPICISGRSGTGGGARSSGISAAAPASTGTRQAAANDPVPRPR